MSDTRTDLPSPKAPNFEQRVREVLMTYLGRQGNPLDRGLTLRDLLENGIIKIRDGYNLRPGNSGTLPLDPIVDSTELDLTPPPQPSGFAVNSAISHVFIEHDAPTYTQGGGHQRTRVYGATWTSGPLPVFSNAIEITQFSGTVHAHPSNPATTWHLWIKWETKAGVLSPTPAGGTNGLVVTTAQDVSSLLDALTGQLGASELTSALNSRINLIDGSAATPGTIPYQLAQEATARADGLAIEAHQRLIGVQDAAEAALNAAIAVDNERNDRVAAVAVAKTELYSDINAGLSAEAGQRTLLAAQLHGGYTGNDLNAVTTGLLYQERIARVTQDEALTLQVTLLSAGVGEQFDWKRIWYFDSGVENWTGNGTPSAVSGFLRPANQPSDAFVASPVGLAVEAATYKQFRLRIRKVGTPTFAGFFWWNGAGESWDVSRRVSITEPTYDVNGIGLVTLNLEWTGTVDQVRVDLSSAQTGTDYFEIDWAAVGRPSPGASNAQLLEEQEARATADSAEASAREALSAAILGQADPTGLNLGNITQGLLYDERQARVTADSAIAQDVSTLQASVTNLGGDVTNLTSTVTTLEQAVADTAGTGASVSQELVSIRRKLDQDAETALRNTVSNNNTRTVADEVSAFARNELTTRIDEGLAAEAAARLVLAAQVDDNSAAIVSESTARADADVSLSTSIDAVTATAAAKNRTYYQASQPTDGLVAGDLWFDTDDGNKPYRWSGSLWVETTDTRITANTAAIVSEQIARANADSALASDIITLSATVDDNTVAIQTEATTRANETGELFAKYTVKIDNNGYVSGFGLASTANNATPFSEFAIVADKFSIAPVASNPAAADGSPFFYITAPTTIGGVSVPAGAYMKAAYIHDATITNAKIADLAVDNAKIASVAVDKLTAGSMQVGSFIQSTSYLAGTSGWRINADGTAEMNNVTVRGGVFATSGLIGGITIANNAVRAGQTAFNTGTGFYLGSNGTFSIGASGGNRLTWDGSTLNLVGGGTFSGNVTGGQFTTGSFTGWAWPPSGQGGSFLGPSGLMLGNANDGKYFQVTAGGNIYMPGLSVVNGVMSISQANVIGTLNIAGNAVTVPQSASRYDSFWGVESGVEIISTSITVTASCWVYASLALAQGFPYGDRPWQTTLYINGVGVFSVGGAKTADSVTMSGAVYVSVPPGGAVSVPVQVRHAGSYLMLIATRTLYVVGSQR